MSERKEAGVTATVEGDARIGLVALCDAAEVTPDTPVRVVVRDVADHERYPARGRRERVVPVAADVEAANRRGVVGRDLEA